MEGADDDNPPLGGDLNSHPQEDDVAPRELPTPPTSPPPPAPQASSGADDDDDGAFSPREQEAVEAAVVAPPSLPSPPTSLSPATELRPRQEAAELPRILPMDEDDGAGRGEDEDDDESVHRHPVSTSHDGLPEILPLDGLAAAAATAQHRPAQDVMPAFGQLMGNDVRPGLATPAYLRQPTLHYNKRKRRGHEYAQQPAPPSTAAPDNGRVVEIDLTDDTAYSAVPASSFPSSMGPNPSSSSSLHPPHPSSSSSSGPHLSQEALRLLMRSMPPQPSLLTRLNNSTQPFPTINPYQAQYQPLTTTTTTSSTSAASYPPPEIDLTQEDDIPLTYVRTDEDSDADEEEICMEIPFGQVLAKVVNTQYFTGILTERETVRLALDHNNIYDQTAIRVENVMGSEVGLLDKRIAACFAPLMERRIMRLQAVIAQKPAANTSIQVILQMFGQPDQKNTVIDRVMEFNLQLEKYVPTKRNVILPSEDHYRAGGSSLQLVGASNGMSLSELEGDVEKLFKSLQDEAANLPEQEPPEPITSRLFPHQKQALYWMSSKEQIRNTFSDEYKVLFWHKRIINGETVYFNSATNSTVKELPPNAQGGILADDMGLGKTLCVISLIMSEIAERKRSRDGATVTASAPASDSAARGEAEPADGEKGKEKEKDLEAEMDSEEVDQSLQQQQRQSPPPPPQQQQQQQQLEDSDDVVEVIEEIDEDLIIFSPPQKRRRPEGFGEFTTSASTRGASVDPPKERPTATLIVCPLSIMSNWEQQISQHVDQEWMEANGVSIYIYHGAGRTKDVEELKKHSIVITTYNILATEYRDEDATANRKKPGRKARGPAASSSVPLDLTSNPSPSSSASSSSSSLSSLLPAYGGMNGGATSSSFVQSALSRFHQFAEFQQPYPSSSSSSSSSAGVVETPASPSQSPLQEINWLRIVLDEGHIIKTRSTRQAKAAFALQAERRWVLTGTPIQNKLDDLFSLIHFVRVHPFENYDWWTSIIVRPMQQEEPKGYQRLQALVGSICLRRTKDQHDRHGRPLVGLPEKKIFIERLKFSAEEKLRYDEIVSQGRKIFSAYMSQGTLLKNYAHVLEMLLRLRQVCCHPRLAAPKPPSYGASIDDEKAEHLLALLQGGEGEECCICLSAMSDPVITTCTHIYCKPCITRAMELSPHCPLCRAPITPESLLVPPPMVQNADVIIEGEKLGRSTKVKFLLKHIQQMKHADPTAKCVIFSQWTSFLDILRQPLEEDKIGFVGLDGRMNHQKRKEVMDTFNNDPSVTALLISLKAGGVGLNLTVASVVFLMDPWWNPAGEEQAMDRVHRLGQTKDVKCVRFVIQDSVEERMLKLQEKKRCMVQGAFGKRSIAELQAMRINELKLLFDDGPL